MLIRSLFKTIRPDKLRGKVAILVPTYRFDPRARFALAAVSSLASDDIAVCIADNSVNIKKWDYLQTIGKMHSNIHIFCHKNNIGAFHNWRFLLNLSDLPYYLFVGDDDFLTPPYVEASLTQLEMHPDAAAAAGLFIMLTSSNKMLAANGARIEQTAAERCINFRIGGGNTVPNSMARRSAVQPFLNYQASHPLHASFFDWIMSYTILAGGTYRTEDKGCYLYDIANWENAHACWRNNAKFYTAAGLPESFTWFHELYWAVEFAHFFRGSHSPLPEPRQRLECAQFFYFDRIQEFRKVWRHPPNAATFFKMFANDAGAAQAVEHLVNNDDASHPELFDWFVELLAHFDQNCARAYKDYTSSSLESA